MTPSSSELWAFDTESSKSFTLVPVSESVAGEQPEDRSYHVLTSYGVRLLHQLLSLSLSSAVDPQVET